MFLRDGQFGFGKVFCNSHGFVGVVGDGSGVVLGVGISWMTSWNLSRENHKFRIGRKDHAYDEGTGSIPNKQSVDHKKNFGTPFVYWVYSRVLSKASSQEAFFKKDPQKRSPQENSMEKGSPPSI